MECSGLISKCLSYNYINSLHTSPVVAYIYIYIERERQRERHANLVNSIYLVSDMFGMYLYGSRFRKNIKLPFLCSVFFTI